METKDFILLMLMPLMLVSLVVYTDKNAGITGAVTANQEEGNIIGTYSIMPSFRAKIGYDLGDYDKVKEQLDAIIECKKNDGDVGYCMQQVQNTNQNFQWELNCDKGTERVLYDFAEFYQNCFESENTNCLCSKDFAISQDEIKKYELDGTEFRVQLKQDSNSKMFNVRIIKPNELAYDFKPNGRSLWYPNDFIITYPKDKQPVLNLFFKSTIKPPEEKFEEIEYNYAFPKKSEVMLYKSESSNIKYVDFVQQKGNNLFYPNDEIVVDSGKKPIDINNIPPCNIKPKSIYRFCVTKKDSKVMAYDAVDGQVKERYVTIKFAAYIP